MEQARVNRAALGEVNGGIHHGFPFLPSGSWIPRSGKTQRDIRSGAKAANLRNRAARAEENRRGHGK